MPIEVIMPKVDMDMDSGTITTWHADEGDLVEQGQPLFDIETDKAAMEVEAPASGRLHDIIAGPGDNVAIGKRLAWIYAEGENVTESSVSTEGRPTSNQVEKKTETTTTEPSLEPLEHPGNDKHSGIRASPLARRLARRNAVDLASLRGSGPRGRVMRKDIDVHLRHMVEPTENPTVDNLSDIDPEALNGDPIIPFKRIPIDRMRATIAKRLTESKRTIPHFYLDMDCRLDALLALRKTLNEAMASKGCRRISINDVIIKASALALDAVPEANASWAGDAILRYTATNIAIAVAVEGGLFTPVIRNAEKLTLSNIAEQTGRLVERARRGKLDRDSHSGSSFSISNLGMFGVKSFAAIINPPESMILAVGKACRTFVPDDNDAPVVATLLPVTLSCDHRVVDGAVGARWLKHFQEVIENPARLLI